MHARAGDSSGRWDARRKRMDDLVDPEFVDFFDSEFLPVVSFLVLTGFDHHTAADATQDAMIDAFRCWSTIEKPAAWIRTAALRRARKRASFARTEVLRLVKNGYGTKRIDGTEAYRELEGHEELVEAMSHLGERQRQVIAFHYGGFAPEEIAGAMGMRPATVRSTLHQARKKLKSVLAGDKGDKKVHR
jgi:RNA polymerase sigma factor (sigma-70 family)